MPYQSQTLQLLTENVRDLALVMLDMQGRVVSWNTSAQSVLRWSEAEIVGQSVSVFFTPEDRATGAPEQELRTAREQGCAENECWYIRKDGSRFWGSSLVQPVYEDGALQGYVQLFRDLTERKRYEQAQREYTLLKGVLDALPAGVVIADLAGRVLHTSPAYATIWGDAPSMPEVEDIREYVGYKRDMGQRVEPQEWALARALHGEICPTELIDIEKFDGSGRSTIATTAAPVRNAAGEIMGGVAVQMDVTAHAGDAEILRLQQAEIERLHVCLQSARQEMHARMKNTFQMAAAMVDMLSDELGESSAAQRMGAVRRIQHYLRMLTLIHDLLTEEAREDRDTSIVNVTVVLQHALRMLQEFHPEKRVQADLAEVMLPVGKAASLCFLVCECMNNAIQYAQEQVEITLNAERGGVRLEVCDDGPGFPPGFDPRIAAHTGLELTESTVRGDLHGKIVYENREQGGGRVVVTFPLDTPSES